MKVTVVIPVGPGHKELSNEAVDSVSDAWYTDPGPFTEVQIERIDDMDGIWGRSWARNQGLLISSDWYFFLDADDRMMPNAFGLVSFSHDATFGSIYLNGKRSDNDRYPCSRDDILKHGSRGTLSMGFFLRAGLDIWFDEGLDKGEDFDFYMRIPSWVKINQPLVNIGYDKPSAGGPRGYKRIQWHKECEKAIDRYRKTHAQTA